MCEIIDPYTSRSSPVACAAAIKINKENRKKTYGGQIEGSYPGERLKGSI